MKTWIALMFLMTAGRAVAVPNQITYQGTLKESGVPVSGARTMQFRLTNSDGSAVYWSGQSMNVAVQQGHFAAVLPMAGVNWRTIQPFIEVSVQGQLLLPREPVSSTAYALMCADVENGSVLRGMIAMFATSCPEGWIRFAPMDNQFPRGGAAFGSQGGSLSHSHVLLGSGKATTGPGGAVGVAQGQHALGAWGPGGGHAVETKQDVTTEADHLPPYLTVVFCQKL